MSIMVTDCRRPPRKWTPDEDAKLIKLIDADFSYAQIGKKLGRTKDSCLGRVAKLEKAGLFTRPNRKAAWVAARFVKKEEAPEPEKKTRKRTRYKKSEHDREPVKTRKTSALLGMDVTDKDKVLPPTIRDLPDEETLTMKTIAEVGLCECRWPVQGRGAAMLCCGAKTDGRIYCDAHSAIAYREKINAK